ncbi:unnamed protein product [Periconia digitata]|uniref:YEATS domain-containing protein n=1 Tax=Periconia digitata TaxID=1303443 RepID=A0A9W4UAN2_9PLEO|nr:unnamed protein product [Periconia digitata]
MSIDIVWLPSAWYTVKLSCPAKPTKLGPQNRQPASQPTSRQAKQPPTRLTLYPQHCAHPLRTVRRDTKALLQYYCQRSLTEDYRQSLSHPHGRTTARMPDIKRNVKLITRQSPISEPSPMEGFPMRTWSIEIYIQDANGNDVPATCFEKAVYNLHPSFEKNKQTFKKPPFRIEEKGWGEFDMNIVLTGAHRGGDHTINHDLNFQAEKYEAVHAVTFRNPKPDLIALLESSGGAETNGARGAKDSSKKKGRRDKTVDMEKLAEGLQKLSEDDLLHVITMVHDNKTSETYVKNDVENGEFHVDLYTLPDSLVKQLWEFTSARAEI